ncbi:MAG: hypothetical protein R3288_07865, partial [Woeseiaceae bacterium]|nr:hypothetical protein [Woeseiaceae bacterium]
TLDSGEALYGGGTAAGRRVQLPWGGSGFDPGNLGVNGLTILKRALEWGAGAGGASLDIQVTDGNDDAEEWTSDGTMLLDSSDLELADNSAASGQPTDIVGIRFPNVAIPQGEVVTVAYIQFQVDELDSGAASLLIEGEATDDALPFTGTSFDISSRLRTTASAPWTPPEWTTIGERGADQRTVNLSSVIQEIVNRPGWASGNALAVIISGSGVRTAESYEGDPGGAPTLHVEFGTETGSGSEGHYLDEFNAVSYSGNDGTLDWSNDWQELGESNGPASGRVSVVSSASQCMSGGCLHIGGDEVSLNGLGLSREADLDGASNAQLTFTVADSGSEASVHLDISDDGGSNWTRLHTYVIGSGIPSTPTPQTFDISPYAASNTQIRFIGSGSPDDAARLYIDDVRIDLAGGGGGGGGGSCDGNYADWFEQYQFDNSDGSLNWTPSPWQEIGESDGPTSGDIRIWTDLSSQRIRIRDNDNGGEGVERQADLTGAATAVFSYDYRRSGLDSSGDYVTVEISANGAAGPWTELARYEGPNNDGSYVTASHDISSFAAPNTRIRLKTSPNMGGSDIVWFDNVELACTP